MKKTATIITLTLTLTLTAAAQERSVRPLRVYLAGGIVDKMVLSSGSSLYHSRLDLNDVEHDDYVSLVVADGEGERRYMLSQVDSLVMPNGRRVVFQGSMTEQPSEARLVESPLPAGVGAGRPRRSSFEGHFPGAGKDNVTFKWTENDRIRLDVGYESRAGQLTQDKTSAQFVFDSADLDAPSYAVYYPGKSVTILSEQTQTGADNTDHIGPSGDCGTATATRNDNVNDNVNFSFTLQHQAAYLCFLPHIDHLPSVRIEKIVLTCSNAIAGTYQLATGGLYNASATSNTITLNLVSQKPSDFFLGHSVNSEQDSCASYMVIAPQDGSRSFTATYYLTDTLSHISKVYRQTFSFRPLANTVYPVSCNIRDTEFRTIDLGLSCNWSNVNVNATEPSKDGPQYTTEAEANAALLEQTIVTEWLIPDADQKEELLTKCQWTWGKYNGRTGYLVTGAAAAKEYGERLRIFLPCASGTTKEQCLTQNYRPVEVLMVDLGLSSGVKWAARNIGANSAEDFGYYYAWGEVEPKTNYTSDTYKYDTQNLGDNFDISGTQNDAAVVNWGGIWRMPTSTEMKELMDSCSWTWSTINGVNGYIVKKNTGGTGNKIFLPAAGIMIGTSLSDSNGRGGYFTSTQAARGNTWYAYSLYFNSGAWHLYNNDVRYPFGNWESDVNQSAVRYYGRTVRAIAAPNAMASDGTMLNIQTDSATWKLGDTMATLYGTLSSTTPIKGSVEVGFVVGDSATIVKDDCRFDYEQTVNVGGSFSQTLDVYDNIGYWYRAYVDTGDTVFYGKARHYGYEMVDLGLSVKWANMNLGADAPEDYGYYFAWGETETKDEYSSSTYLYGTRNLGNGTLHDISGTENDAAHVNMGNAWRMPTNAEMAELMNSDNCSWVYMTQNNVNGYKVTSLLNGNSIFLPATGLMSGTSLVDGNSRGSYLTSVQGSDNSWYAYALYFNSDAWYLYHTDKRYPFGNWESDVNQSAVRYYGRAVRAVAAPNSVTPDGLVLDIRTDSATWKLADTSVTLYGTLSSTTPLSKEVKVGFIIGDNDSIVKSTARVDYPQTTSTALHYSQILPVHDNLGYWYRAYVETTDTIFYGEAKHYGLEMVDLGLPSGILWANMNVGASSPEEYGCYYAWGETNTKSDYSSGTYQYGSRNLGNGIYHDIVGTEHDAAHVNMGNAWRMPTNDDMEELMNSNYCSWVYMSQNNVNGYKVTSRKNGNSIFLPATGMMVGASHIESNSRGSYFTSVQGGDNSWYAYSLYFNSGAWYLYHTDIRYPFGNWESDINQSAVRYYGRTVRAVAKPNATLADSSLVMNILTDSATWKLGDTSAMVYGTVSSNTPLPEGTKVGFVWGNSAAIDKSNATGVYTISTPQYGSYSHTITGLSNNMGYWYRAYVEAPNGEVFYGTARHFGWEMVDLGLPTGTLWCNMNVGSSWPEDYGNYYAWGDTAPKESYTSGTYNYGTTVLGEEGNIAKTLYDAAYENMNSNWCMPTDAQLSELMNGTYCKWEWATVNDVNGQMITSRVNGKSIFLPAAGFMSGSSLSFDSSRGSYFGSLIGTDNSYAYTLYWYSGGRSLINSSERYPFGSYDNDVVSHAVRYFGRSVRAVAVQTAPRP